MKTLNLALSLLILSFCLPLSAESIVDAPSSSSLIADPQDRNGDASPTPEREEMLTVVIESHVYEPSGRVSKEQDIIVIPRKSFPQRFGRALDDLDRVSLEQRGYVKVVRLRHRGTL